jgi:hypothetical protein
MTRAKRLWAGLAVTFLAVPAAAQAPNGAEFRVNTYTTGSQWRADVATDRSGHFVVAFADQQGSTAREVVVRRFTSAGRPRGAEFRVNTFTTDGQSYPAVASDRAGNFVVTWESYGQDGDRYGIFGQRYDAAGTAVGGEFQVNTFTTGWQYSSAVAMGPDGNFVVVWQSDGEDGSGAGVFGRRFDVVGGAFGPPFTVSSTTGGHQQGPSVAMAADGSFVVAWYGNGPGDGFGVFARRFAVTGTPLGDEFRVNTNAVGNQFSPSVSASGDGAFVVVWQSYVSSATGADVFGQRFDSSGNPIGAQFAVSNYVTGDQMQPKVALDDKGAFMVTWWTYLPPAIGGDTIRARQFDASGIAVGGEFGVNTYTTGTQTTPVIATGPAGHFVIVWQGTPVDGSQYGVFGQRFGDLIFADTLDAGPASP